MLSAIAASRLRHLHFPQFFNICLFQFFQYLSPQKLRYRFTPLCMGPLTYFPVIRPLAVRSILNNLRPPYHANLGQVWPNSLVIVVSLLCTTEIVIEQGFQPLEFRSTVSPDNFFTPINLAVYSRPILIFFIFV